MTPETEKTSTKETEPQKILVGAESPGDREEAREWARNCLETAARQRLDSPEEEPEQSSLVPVGRSSRPGVWYVHLKDLENDLDVRLRQVKTEGKEAEKAIMNFLLRAQNLLRFDHRTFASTWAIVRHDPWISIIGEYVDGMPLDAFVEDIDGVGGNLLLRFAYLLCHSLGKAARLQAHHLNVTPSNVIINRSGTPRLTDPSLKRLYSAAPDFWNREVNNNEEWIPPEIRSEPDQGDARSDIYLVGKLLFYLKEHVLKPARNGSAFLDSVIRKATREDPSDRYRSFRFMSLDLPELDAESPEQAALDVSFPAPDQSRDDHTESS